MTLGDGPLIFDLAEQRLDGLQISLCPQVPIDGLRLGKTLAGPLHVALCQVDAAELGCDMTAFQGFVRPFQHDLRLINRVLRGREIA